MKLRASLTDKRSDITGTIEIDGDGVFILECAVLIIETLAKRAGVSRDEFLDDLKRMPK